MNAKNATFFYNEHKKTQEHSCSFIKNAKEHAFFYKTQNNTRQRAFFDKARKRMQENACSFIKNAKEGRRT